MLSSRDEAFGLVITEAEVCGLPIVSFDCPSAPAELVEDGINGYVVKMGDVQCLATRVMLLMKDIGLRQRMGCESVRVAEQFDVEVIAGEWKKLYEQMNTA